MQAENSQAQLRIPALVSLAAMCLLWVGSIIYYKERMLFADDAYISFNIANYREIGIQEGRYGSFITQLGPYCAQALHLSLRSVLVVYSMTFNLFYLSVAA